MAPQGCGSNQVELFRAIKAISVRRALTHLASVMHEVGIVMRTVQAGRS